MYTAPYLLLVLIALVNSKKADLSDYCKFDKTNTPCKTKCAKAKSCKGFIYVPLTRTEKDEILHAHNQYRNEVAGGLHEDKLLPKGSNINVLSYDKEAEFTVMCWMIQCKPSGHDDVRIGRDGVSMGQNLYTYINKVKEQVYTTSRKLHLHAINRYFEETRFVEQKEEIVGKCNVNKIHDYGHLTALLWWKTKYVGCAKMIWPDDLQWYYHIGCNYYPEGNDVNQRVYKEGEPASNCSHAVPPNDTYKNLCGVQRRPIDDTYVSPFGDLFNDPESSSYSLGGGDSVD